MKMPQSTTLTVSFRREKTTQLKINKKSVKTKWIWYGNFERKIAHKAFLIFFLCFPANKSKIT